MSITQSNKVDSLTIEKDKCILGISDHLTWDDEHILLLQEKINHYLHYILEGQINENVSNLDNYDLIIQLIYKYEPNGNYVSYLIDLKENVKKYGITFEYGGVEMLI